MIKSVRSFICLCSLAACSVHAAAQSSTAHAQNKSAGPAAAVLSQQDLDQVQQKAAAEAERWRGAVSMPAPIDAAREAQTIVDTARKGATSIMGLEAPKQDLSGIRTVVFISTSMAESSLRSLLNQGAGRHDTIFVLRGWRPVDANTPPAAAQLGFQQIISRLGALIKQPDNPPTVMMHPYAFEAYKVDRVPVVLHKLNDGRWKRLTGEISVHGAIEEMEKGRAGTVGPTWAIAEPNILDIIEDRARQFDWQRAVSAAKDRSYDRMFDGLEVPAASLTHTRLFDPSVIVDRDYKTPDGSLIAARGAVVNPLDYQPFTKAVIAIDPYDQAQLELGRRWLKDHPDAIVFVTRNAIHSDGRPTWQVLGVRTYPINELVLQRFGIFEVPALVRQSGRKMAVHVEKVR